MANLSYVESGIILLAVAYFGDKLWQKYVLGLEDKPRVSEASADLDTQTDTVFNKGKHTSKKDLSEFGFEMVIDTNSVVFVGQLRYESDPEPTYLFSANFGGQIFTFRAKNPDCGWFSNGSVDPKLIRLRQFLIDCIG